MDYDSWKLETPEDEYARKHRGRNGWRGYRDREACWKCQRDWKADADDELLCSYCGADAQDQPTERDPDDARDEERDERMGRR